MTIDMPKPARRIGIVSPPGISDTARPTSDTARPASLDPFFTTRFAVPSTCRPPWLNRRFTLWQLGADLLYAPCKDDCQLVSALRARTETVWLFSNGDDLFVSVADVLDVWEVACSGRAA